MLLMLREIYSALGVRPDSTVPQQSMTVQRNSSLVCLHFNTHTLLIIFFADPLSGMSIGCRHVSVKGGYTTPLSVTLTLSYFFNFKFKTGGISMQQLRKTDAIISSLLPVKWTLQLFIHVYK